MRFNRYSLASILLLITDSTLTAAFVGVSFRSHPTTALWAAPDLSSDDPFKILGIEPTATLDKKEIKRAYKKLALKYHPDVAKDMDKKEASNRFSKINWAYEMLSGKNGQSTTSTSSSSSGASSSWAPPHRRQASTASTNGYSVDWQDFMPKYDDAQYDAGDDSFGAIFADLIGGLGSAGSGGIFRDFVEFLEQNFDGYSGSSSDDAQFRILLQTGSVDEIGDEMDETELVVTQLKSKIKNIENELISKKADLNIATRFSEKIDLEETVQELEARKKVVDGYMTRAKKRLLSLQTRYKELIVAGRNDSRAGGRQRTSESWSSDSQNPKSETKSTNTSGTKRESSSSSSRTTSETKSEDSWKTESFGSSGRGSGRGRGRGRSGRSTVSVDTDSFTTDSRGPSTNSDEPRDRVKQEPTSTSRAAPSPTTSSSSTQGSYVPPHRRNTSSSYSSVEEDRRRLRDLQVDDEFDKLKKELGL